MSNRFGGKIKQFARVGPNNETLIEYSLNQALCAGFNKIIFIVGKKTEKGFKEMFGENYKGVQIEYAFQDFDEELRDGPLGTLDALCSAQKFLDCPFVVCNGDDIYGEEAFKKLVNHLKENKNSAAIGYNVLESLSANGSVNRGLFEIDEKNNLISMVEVFDITKENFFKKGLTEKSLCGVNLFAFPPEIFNSFNKILIDFKEKNKGNRNIECLLPVEMGNLINQENLKIYVYSTSEKFIGVTNPGDEEVVRKILSHSNIYK